MTHTELRHALVYAFMMIITSLMYIIAGGLHRFGFVPLVIGNLCWVFIYFYEGHRQSERFTNNFYRMERKRFAACIPPALPGKLRLSEEIYSLNCIRLNLEKYHDDVGELRCHLRKIRKEHQRLTKIQRDLLMKRSANDDPCDFRHSKVLMKIHTILLLSGALGESIKEEYLS